MPYKRYTETELSAASLDQPACESTPKKLVICSSPRSGSFLLCRLLVNAGIGVPHEYFNFMHFDTIGRRFGIANTKQALQVRESVPGLMDRYIDILLRHRCQNGIFVAKVQFWEYKWALVNPAGRRLLHDAAFLHLYRDDLLAQAISVRFARLTGRWGFDDAVTTQPHPAPNFFDFAAIDEEIVKMANEDTGWRVFFAQHGISPLPLSYEALCRDQRGAVDQVARLLGLPAPPARLPRVTEREAYGPPVAGVPSRDEVAAAYIAHRRLAS